MNIEMPSKPNDEVAWSCSDCSHTLTLKDWPYSKLATDGGPICPACDCDMDYVFQDHS